MIIFTAFLEDGNMHEYKTPLRSYMRVHPVEVILVFVMMTAVVAVACSMLFHAKRIHKYLFLQRYCAVQMIKYYAGFRLRIRESDWDFLL